ncbi:MAG: hypothetical protein A3F67_06285 [Verrucomicrobia bacterium RIFCSPHIGHO2_12_FULL_41_10]|nr:MAG: hypothetical protein A3F67_06285 [Verrucomicrobia bacterium RIFCSPHIGHO2_12_FULL_41_10]HLB33513.1 C4-type zinc ribbon domain-containing protein [Chthoniobacterales bacterium]
MLESLEQLLILQDRDQKIRDFSLALQALPQEKSGYEKEIKNAQEHVEALSSEQRSLELELKKLEGEVSCLQEKINRYRTQQQETRKNDEYAAFNHEIAAAEKLIASLEERELFLMEQLEAMKGTLQEAKEEHHSECQRLTNLLEGLERRQEQIVLRQQELIDDRPRLLEGIEEDLLERYTRLFKSKQGAAVVPVEHHVCTGCHMQVTAQTVLATKASKEITSCTQCGRLLYCEEE